MMLNFNAGSNIQEIDFKKLHMSDFHCLAVGDPNDPVTQRQIADNLRYLVQTEIY